MNQTLRMPSDTRSRPPSPALPLLILSLALFAAPSCRKKTVSPSPYCSVGTEVANSLMDNWSAAAVTEETPQLHHEGRGNRPGAKALLEGVCQLAVRSRPMEDEEVHPFVERFGAPPLAIPVAVEALVIAVPANLKLNEIDRNEAKRLFTEAPPTTQGTVLESHYPHHRLAILGQNSASDRYRWVKRALLDGEDFSDRVQELPGPLQLVDTLKEKEVAFGYARPGELRGGTKALTLRTDRGLFYPGEEAIRSGSYPLVRYIYFYIRPEGSGTMDPALKRFMAYALSEEGQKMLKPLGFYPLSASDLRRSREALTKITRNAP